MEPAILIFAFVLVLVGSAASAALTWGLCASDYKRQLARELEAKDRAHRHHLAEIRDALAAERKARDRHLNAEMLRVIREKSTMIDFGGP